MYIIDLSPSALLLDHWPDQILSIEITTTYGSICKKSYCYWVHSLTDFQMSIKTKHHCFQLPCNSEMSQRHQYQSCWQQMLLERSSSCCSKNELQVFWNFIPPQPLSTPLFRCWLGPGNQLTGHPILKGMFYDKWNMKLFLDIRKSQRRNIVTR